ncbi:putative Zinc metalloproteinase nas-14 [Hypsibius exemplaris]|uniref:Metalloendopeptidase n=1 Tax=Hypsibius exemplaris TaxID=2072580 RepID=A0A1W0X5Y8_HYPEX|nr:putative Zinc metalloproteinase nas-14 [Hypsibius exemplaris]
MLPIIVLSLVVVCFGPTVGAVPVGSLDLNKEPFDLEARAIEMAPPAPQWVGAPQYPGDDTIGVQVERSGLIDTAKRWPKNATTGWYDFNYYITPNFTAAEKSLILVALNIIHRDIAKVAVRPWVSGKKEYVYIRKGLAGSGYVGMQKGGQIVNLEVSHLGTCMTKHTVLHELTHALGFHHEHTRPDRDSYLEIVQANIKPAYLHNFQKYSSQTVTTAGTAYDFASVMGYGLYSFAINPAQQTMKILPKWSHLTYGWGAEYSRTDITEINLMYP